MTSLLSISLFIYLIHFSLVIFFSSFGYSHQSFLCFCLTEFCFYYFPFVLNLVWLLVFFFLWLYFWGFFALEDFHFCCNLTFYWFWWLNVFLLFNSLVATFTIHHSTLFCPLYFWLFIIPPYFSPLLILFYFCRFLTLILCKFVLKMNCLSNNFCHGFYHFLERTVLYIAHLILPIVSS